MKKNVTFADIAEYTGFSKTTISRYFNNPDSVTIENQEKIANALGVETWELFATKDEVIGEKPNTITCPRCGARFKLEEEEKE